MRAQHLFGFLAVAGGIAALEPRKIREELLECLHLAKTPAEVERARRILHVLEAAEELQGAVEAWAALPPA